MTARLLANVTCIAVEGRGLLLEGKPGSGKSTLALALIDRGATLVGDDGVILERRRDHLWAHPPPHISGKIEIRNVGIITLASTQVPLSLVLSLGSAAERLPTPGIREIDGFALPCLGFDPNGSTAAVRAEWALRLHGLAAPPDYA